ncbi:MAG TPA: insulinase family protein [Treponema sp.]|nr:insulinase family protein [Treponema sp.]
MIMDFMKLTLLQNAIGFKNGMKKRFFLVLCGICLFSLLITCAGAPKGEIYGGLGQPSDPVPVMEKARTGTLPGGLRYFILENSTPENRAYLTLAVKAGSVLEADDEQGLAHFVEHMAFNGTARFPEDELVNYLRSLGMRFGPEVNAYTSFDETVYGIEVPVETGADGIRRIPSTALAVIDDWTRAITFAPKDVDDERAVILEEYRARLGAMDRLRRQMLPVLFKGSQYAVRLPIGQQEIIENAPASRLEDFYRRWYRADNMALILAGDFDGAALEDSLAEHFSISAPATPLDRPSFDLPNPKKGQAEVLILTDPELTATRIDIYYKRDRQIPRGDLSYYREEIIDILIGRMLGFRFEEAAAKSETPYIYAGAGNIRYGSSSRFYVMTAQAKTAAAEDTLAELLREKESLLRYGFAENELALAAGSLVSDMRRMVSEKDKQESSGYINYMTRFFLQGGNFPDLEWELDAIERMLPHIGASDINAALKDYFKYDDVTVFISAPEAELANLPTEEQTRRMLRESRKMKVSPPEAAGVDEGFLSSAPNPGQIISRSSDEETGAILWELSNGAKIILKETNNKNNEIIFQAMARGGNSSAAPEDWRSVELASEMITASGLGPYTHADLMKKLADKQVALSFWTGGYYRGIQGSATNEDLENLFEMIYLGFTDPRIDPEAVNALLDQRRTALAQRSANPEAFFADEVNKVIYGGHPFFKPPELADLSTVNTGSALAFIQRCLNPADYTFVFTGNLDINAMQSYAETYIASIPQSESFDEWTRLEFRRPGKAEKTFYKGKDDKSLVYMTWFAPVSYSEPLSAATQVLTEYLDIKMTEEIREKLGGVYSISVGVSVSPVPEGELSMSVFFACDPRRADELSQAVLDVIGQTAIDEDTFVKSAAALKKQWETSMQSNSYIAQSYANSSVLLDLPLSRLNKRPQYYDEVTPADIQQLRSLLLQDGPARFVLYPGE